MNAEACDYCGCLNTRIQNTQDSYIGLQTMGREKIACTQSVLASMCSAEASNCKSVAKAMHIPCYTTNLKLTFFFPENVTEMNQGIHVNTLGYLSIVSRKIFGHIAIIENSRYCSLNRHLNYFSNLWTISEHHPRLARVLGPWHTSQQQRRRNMTANRGRRQEPHTKLRNCLGQ